MNILYELSQQAYQYATTPVGLAVIAIVGICGLCYEISQYSLELDLPNLQTYDDVYVKPHQQITTDQTTDLTTQHQSNQHQTNQHQSNQHQTNQHQSNHHPTKITAINPFKPLIEIPKPKRRRHRHKIVKHNKHKTKNIDLINQ